MVLGSEAFRKCLGPEGGTVMNGIGALIKEALESSLTPPTMRRHQEKQVVCKLPEVPCQDTTTLGP